MSKKTSPVNVRDQITSIEDIFKLYKATEDQKILLDYNGTDEKMTAARCALAADIIAEVLNNGKTPKDGWGWLPYYNPQRGFAFSLSDYDLWISRTRVSARALLS